MDVIVNFSAFVSFQLKVLKVIGLALYETNNQQSWRIKLLRKVYRYFVIISLAYFLCTLMFSMIQSFGNLALFTELLSTFGYGVMAIVRIVSINLGQEKFNHLMGKLMELFPKTKKDQNFFETHLYYSRFNRMRKIVSGFIMSGGIIFLVGPFIKFVTTGNWINKLPFPNWYPFDQYDPKYYNFVLLWQMHHIMCVNASIVGPDLILYAFCTLISMEFDNLCRRTRELKTTPPKDVGKELNELIERHKTLIQLSEDLCEIFSAPIFFNFFESSVLICMYGYQLIIAETLTEIMQYSNLVIVTLIQVFMICYYGNILTVASEAFAQSVYDSGWNCRRFQKSNNNLVLILRRSQKPIVLTAFVCGSISGSLFYGKWQWVLFCFRWEFAFTLPCRY